MSPRTGRPKSDDPKNIRLEIALTKNESDLLSECAKKLKCSRTSIINRGVRLVKKEIEDNE